MAHHADSRGVGNADLHSLLHRRRHAFDDREPGLARPEDDVGLQDGVAEARERRKVVWLAVRRAHPPMHAVGQPLVQIHDRRVTFPRFVSGRIEQRRLETLAAIGFVFDDLASAPRVLLAERVRLRDRLYGIESRSADVDRRRIVERFRGELKDADAIAWLAHVRRWGAYADVTEAERQALLLRELARDRRIESALPLDSASDGRSARTQAQPPISGSLRPDAEHAHVHRTRRIDCVFVGIEPRVAESDLVRGAVGEPDGAGAVSRNLPQIEFVVQDDALVVDGPAGDAERRLLFDGCVRFAIDERRADVLRDVRRRARRRIDRPVVIVLKEQHVSAARAHLRDVIVGAFLDLRALARGEIDKIQIRRRPADAAVHRVRRPVRGVGERLMLHRRDLFGHFLSELHETVGREMPGREHAAFAVRFRAHLLLRQHVGVAPVPHVDARRFVGRRGAVLRVGDMEVASAARRRRSGRHCAGLNPARDPEKHDPVIRPGRLSIRHNPHPGGERLIGGRIVHVPAFGCVAELRPRERDVRRPIVAVVALRAQHCEIVGVLSPREAGVDCRRGIEHPQRAGLRVEQLHAVSGLVRDRNRQREEPASVLPRKLADVTERHIAAVGKMSNHEGRTHGTIVFGRRRCVGRRLLLGLWRVPPQGEVRAARVERERLDVVQHRLLATLQIENPGLLVDRLLFVSQFVFLRLREADAVRRPSRVGGKHRLRAEWNRRRRPIGNLEDPKLVLAIRTVDAVCEPVAVAGQPVLHRLKRLPPSILRWRDRRFALSAAMYQRSDYGADEREPNRSGFHLNLTTGRNYFIIT